MGLAWARMMSRAFEEHTGEVRLRLQAESLPGLFEEAALAVAELMCSERSAPGEGELPVRVGARDREALLAAWVDELVFLSETRKRVWSVARVEQLTETELVATVRGFEPAALRTQIKAATLHDLHIAQTPSGSFEATMVLDV